MEFFATNGEIFHDIWAKNILKCFNALWGFGGIVVRPLAFHL